MNRKKILSIVIASSLIFGTTMNVLAESKINTKPIQMNVGNMPQKYQDRDIKLLEKEKAVKLAKEYIQKFFNIEINDEYSVQSNFYNYDGINEPNWEIRFYLNKEKERQDISISISAIDEKVLSYNNYDGYYNEGDIAEYSYSQAKEIALKKIKEIFPEEFKQIRVDENTISTSGYNGEYYFSFTRENQGILFKENYISARVDGQTGVIESINIDWDSDAKFPSTEEAIGSKKAEDIFIDGIEFDLRYKQYRNKYRYQDEDNNKNIKLIYDLMVNKGSYIDALTGKFIYNNKDEKKNKEIELTEKEKQEIISKFKKIEKFNAELKEEKAYEILSEIVEKYYGEGFEKQRSYYNYKDEDKSWSFRLIKREKLEEEVNTDSKEKEENIKERITNLYITLDAETGKIENLSKYSRIEQNGKGYYENSEEFKAVISWEDAYKKAVEFISENYEDKLKNIDYKITKQIYTNRKGVETQERRYYYTFNRVENGVVFSGNSISITVDAEDGMISNVYCNWYEDEEFVSPENKIDIEEVEKITREKYEPVLRYVRDGKEIKLAYVYEGTKKVYNFNDCDAFTGEFLNYSGEEIIENVSEFMKEIKDSDYRKQLEILAYSGLMDIRDFELNKEITNRDLIKAIVDAFGYRRFDVAEEATADMAKDGLYNLKESVREGNKTPENGYDLTDEDYIEMAKFYGIISDKVDKNILDMKVNKMCMAKAMIKFTGYEDIAQIKGIFKVEANDADKIEDGDIGYAALSVGFDILKIENKKVNPNENVDSEELFRSLFYALKHKKNQGYSYPVFRYEK